LNIDISLTKLIECINYTRVGLCRSYRYIQIKFNTCLNRAVCRYIRYIKSQKIVYTICTMSCIRTLIKNFTNIHVYAKKIKTYKDLVVIDTIE
jgi:hypothetical protein